MKALKQKLIISTSMGWFERFETYHSLHNTKISCETASTDTNAVNNYPEVLKKTIKEGGYIPKQVFNVNETRLYWKCMTDSIHFYQREVSIWL